MEAGDCEILGLTLELTCRSHPEQYDVFGDGDERIGYLRLRHGEFTVSTDGPFDGVLYRGTYGGNAGEFEDDDRERWLTAAVKDIKAYYARPPHIDLTTPGLL